MPKLTNEELLLLDTLIYSDYAKNGKKVSEIIKQAEKDLKAGKLKTSSDIISKKDWEKTFKQIKNSNLNDYVVTNYENNEATGMRAACFVDDANNPSDVNVVFRGTTSDGEWHDNGQGMYMSDTPEQIASAEYINNLPEKYGNNLTVSGHSKGGNRAQYVTITTDRVERCVSYDGQGFSKQFVDKYNDKIMDRKSRIKSISAENDMVNTLLQPIAGERIYIKTKDQGGWFKIFNMKNHNPCILLDDSGKLRERVNGPSPDQILLNEYTMYIDRVLKEPEKSYATDGLLGFLETGKYKNQSTKDLIIHSLREDNYGGESPMQGIVGVIIAAGHLDDFMIHFLLKYYGSNKAVVAAILAVLLPMAAANPLIVGKNLLSVLNAYLAEAKSLSVQSTVSAGGGNDDFIYVSPQGLRTEAKKLKMYKSDYVDITKKMSNLITTLQEEHIWDAPATDAFVESYLAIKGMFDKFGTMIAEYATIMDGVANRMEETDNQYATKFRAISLR